MFRRALACGGWALRNGMGNKLSLLQKPDIEAQGWLGLLVRNIASCLCCICSGDAQLGGYLRI